MCLWVQSALFCPAATSQLQRAPRHERCPATRVGDLVVKPWRRLFPAVTSTSVVLKPFCKVRALTLLKDVGTQAGPDFAEWFIVLKFMALLCPCHQASLLEGLVCRGFSPAKWASKEKVPIRC